MKAPKTRDEALQRMPWFQVDKVKMSFTKDVPDESVGKAYKAAQRFAESVELTSFSDDPLANVVFCAFVECINKSLTEYLAKIHFNENDTSDSGIDRADPTLTPSMGIEEDGITPTEKEKEIEEEIYPESDRDVEPDFRKMNQEIWQEMI